MPLSCIIRMTVFISPALVMRFFVFMIKRAPGRFSLFFFAAARTPRVDGKDFFRQARYFTQVPLIFSLTVIMACELRIIHLS